MPRDPIPIPHDLFDHVPRRGDKIEIRLVDKLRVSTARIMPIRTRYLSLMVTSVDPLMGVPLEITWVTTYFNGMYTVRKRNVWPVVRQRVPSKLSA